jgi:hypothetical protein
VREGLKLIAVWRLHRQLLVLLLLLVRAASPLLSLLVLLLLRYCPSQPLAWWLLL